MRPTLFFIVLIVLIFTISISLALGGQGSLLRQVDASGQVLGVSETSLYAPPEIAVQNSGFLPENEPHYLSMPAKKDGTEDYELDSAAGIVFDCTSGEVVFAKNHEEAMPIASITKIATALTFLDFNPGWDSYYTVQADDITSGGMIYLSVGDEVKIKDLLNLSLVASANSAARALVHSTGMSEEEFVADMNERVAKLGLANTFFRDPIGLSRFNTSTALEVAQLLQVALKNTMIQQATLTKRYSFRTKQGRNITAASTDMLLGSLPEDGIELLGGKTGHTNIAGYCFAGKFSNSQGNELISVVLGDTGKYSRFAKTKELVDWVYDNYVW